MAPRYVIAPLLCLAVACWPVAEAGATSSTLCVGAGAGCYGAIQVALDASHPGDTIVVGRGTFAGGLQVDHSVRIVGAGAARTIIRGGASVVTIGTAGAASEPTVRIAGVTITGGVTHSSPMSVPFVGEDGVFAAGGGIEIPPNVDFSGGATVTISRSVISGNRVAPTRTVPFGPPCPGGPCPFAAAFGGGIDSWGTLTLIDSSVRNNVVAGVASDADGAGIASHLAPLVLRHTTVNGNRALASRPNGRFAEGGGLFVEAGRLRIIGSVITGNSAVLRTNLPAFAGGGLIEMNANSGGLHVGNDVPTRIDHVAISDNVVRAVGRRSEPCAFDSAGLVNDSPLVMRHVLIARNRVTDVAKTLADVGSCGSAFDSDGGRATISHMRMVGNRSTVISRHGLAAAAGGFSVLGSSTHAFRLVTISDSVIEGNLAIARSGLGFAAAEGGGVFNNALLRLSRVVVRGNAASAFGPAGVEQGGGIWSGVLLTGPPVRLTLWHSLVTRNVLPGQPGIQRLGGGLFSAGELRLRGTPIFANLPDDCFGCGGGTAARSHAAGWLRLFAHGLGRSESRSPLHYTR